MLTLYDLIRSGVEIIPPSTALIAVGGTPTLTIALIAVGGTPTLTMALIAVGGTPTLMFRGHTRYRGRRVTHFLTKSLT